MVRAAPSPVAPSHWLIPAVVLVAAVLLVYWNSRSAPFLFDDLSAVVHNPTIRQFRTALTPTADGNATTGRPLVNLSFALNHAFGGESVRGYHAVNILIHAAATLALFGLLRCTRAVTEPLAFAIALLWAVHPLQTESVTCIAQRTESLCGLFILLTLYGFARGGRWLGLSVLACLLGMATKEVMVTAPLLVLLYDRTFVAGSFAAAWRARRGYYGALAATWLLLAWLVLSGGGVRGSAAGLGLGVSWWSYLLKQSEAIVLYLKLSFWPHPLVVDYGTAVVDSWREVWWQGPVVLALLGSTIWALVRRPVLGFVGAWFFLILAPSSSVVPLVSQTMAEHRMYLPLAAVVALVLGAVAARRSPRTAAALGLALAVAAGLATVQRNRVYLSEQALWEDVLAHHPANARALNNLGRVHFQQGRIDEAILRYRAALLLEPANPHLHANLGQALLNSGRIDEALAPAAEAVRLLPNDPDARLNLGIALTKLGRPEEALPHLAAAIRLDPAPAEAQLQCGIALAALGRWPEASEHYAIAVQLRPGSAEAHSNWGVARFQLKDAAGAIAQFEQALRLKPDLPEVHFNLALALGAEGRWPEARAHLEMTIRLRPDFAPAQDLLRSLEAGHQP